jgi:hypothetical protein
MSRHGAALLALPLLAAACLAGGLGPGATPTPEPRATTLMPTTRPLPTATLAALPTLPPSPTAPAIAAPPEFPFHGLELSHLTEEGGLGRARAAGAYWIRWPAVWWPDIEAQEGVRDWSAVSWLDDQLAAASAAGRQVILIVRGTPAWAQARPGIACGPISPEKLGAFASFTADLVARYSAPPFNVKYWELWNEPDIDPALAAPDSPFGCWGDQTDPHYGGGYYADMLKAVYPAIKTADPAAQVLNGGLLLDCDPVTPPPDRDCTSARFFEGALLNGAGPYFDGVSFHAYDYYARNLPGYLHPGWNAASNTTGPVFLAKLNYLQSLLAAHGLDDKYLMNTEVAILCGRDGTEPNCVTPEAVQMRSAYVAQVYAEAAAAGLRANIWYSYLGWRASGMVDASGNPVPAYQAYQQSAAALTGAAFVRPLDEFPGLRGYEFRRAGQRVWTAWSLAAAPVTMMPPSPPARVADVYGQPLAAAAEFSVGQAPVYMEWDQP